MKFHYTISEEHFLEYYLYMVSESTVIQRKRNIAKYSFSVLYVLFGLYFLVNYRLLFGGIFVGLGITWFFFYPALNKKSLRRFYSKYIRENYALKMNRETTLTFLPDSLLISDGATENRIPVTELEKVTETLLSFFLTLKSGTSFIVPKNQVEAEIIKDRIESAGIAIHEKVNWQWE